jgi:hypothetical protein
MVDAYRYRGFVAELSDFYRDRARAMRAAFGAEQPVEQGIRLTGLPVLLDASVRSLATSPSPFAGFLEATTDIADKYHRHGPAINAAIEGLQTAILTMLFELIRDVYGVPLDRTIDDAALAEQGFDIHRPWPDPLDYL